MNNPPYHTETVVDGRRKMMSSKIWTVTEALIVAKDQFEFLKKEVFIVNALGHTFYTVSSIETKQKYR